MTRELIPTSAFHRALKRVLKRQPQVEPAVQRVLVRLADDAFEPSLRTHKLKGQHADQWSCSVAYDLRIVFEFIQHNGVEAILLHTLGTHDEVY